MAGRQVAITVAVLAVPLGLAAADDSYRHARVRVVEPVVSLQSAVEAGAEEAVPNMPFLPGDRVWTDSRGRVEFHFADGSLLRVDRRSKLDYDGYDADRGGQVVLRLWSGSVYVHQREQGRSAQFVIETPSAAATMHERGVYRVDVQAGETRLSVFEGDAYLEADDRVRVSEGERAYARRGERPLGPERFDRADNDDFALWDAVLGDDTYDARNEYLPEEVSPFAEDFDRNGSWYVEAGVGNVWRPHVAASWRPYTFGNWAWTSYGWTWVPNEPWGWAPFHYGRWGHSTSIGWYWVPGRTWGPAWVSWSVSDDHVGWCPLGFRDRPVEVHGRDRDRAVPRGSADRSAWNYVRKGDLAARDVARRRVEAGAVPVERMRVVEQGRARVTREGTIAEGAVPRNIRTKPGIGDTVPELRTDNMTTIPFPVARTKYESERERERERQDPDNASPAWSPRGRRPPADSGIRPETEAAPDVTGWRRRQFASADQPAPAATPSPEAVRRRPEPSRTEDGDREALRPWFRKLSRPRDDDRPATPPREEQARPRQRSRSEDSPSPRPEPRPLRAEPKRERERVSPPPPPPPRNDGGRERGAVRREKNRDNR